MSTPAEKVEQLRRQIEHHNHLYYVQARPEISDREFDKLMAELIELEEKHPELRTADSPTQRVGGQPIEGFVTVQHAVPMMSIDNTYDAEAVRAFDARVRKALGDEPVTYVLEPKVDGVSGSLRYEEGLLVLAATRGDGQRGDDITAQARTIRSIPLRLHGRDIPRILEIRGEIHMSNEVFQTINKQREESGEEIFKNPRNLTTGTLKQLDPKITASRRLQFVCHGLGQVEPMPTDSYWEFLGLLKKWTLPVSEYIQRAATIDEVVKIIDKFGEARGQLPFQTDGMVVKVDSFRQREKLGATSKAPRWVIAYKYQAEQQQTVLKAVDWQVGKGGTLTPVARLEPVFIAGTTVSNATLHNIDQIRKLDLHIGDTVVLEKAGEVIPYVSQVIADKRPRGANKVEPPVKCPVCSSPARQEEGTPYIRCDNPECPGRIREQLQWFCGRNQMDIENVGEALVDQLVNLGLVRSFADLYRLKKTDLLNLDRMADKSAQNVIDAIAGSRGRGLDRLLAGLGIRHVGNRVAGVLAGKFLSLEVLAGASVEQLSGVNEIGPVIAASVHEFFSSPRGRQIVADLKSVGIDPVLTRPAETGEQQLLEGQTVVVTGTMEHYTRAEIEGLVTSLGGRAAGSVSKKTSFVVAGPGAGSKLDKARELGVPVMTEVEFLKKIGKQ
jgi:DNA ligase (NAD+)